MENIRKELSVEEMKTIGGAGLLDSVGNVLKTVTHEVAVETSHLKNTRKRTPAPKQAPSQTAKPAPENAMLNIFRNLAESVIRSF